MNGLLDFFRQVWDTAYYTARAGTTSVTSHWALALFSLVAAFGVWMAIQDVENPRVAGAAPASGAIEVEAVNVPDNYLVDTIQPVTVRVEARQEVLDDLAPGDFEAKVDVSSVPLDGTAVNRPVRVTSRRDDVRILEQPPEARIQLVRAVDKEVPVTVNRTSPLPGDYTETAPPQIDPAIVTVTGREDLVRSVDTVQLDVGLAGVRQENFRFKGPLVARSRSGNAVEVQISQGEATATFAIELIRSTATVTVLPKVTGAPPPGFRLGEIVTDPPTIVVTGPKNVIDSLGSVLYTEPVDITGARQTVTKPNVAIVRPANVSVIDRSTGVVTVKVDILPTECGGNSTICEAQTLFLAPRFVDAPPDLMIDPRAYQVQVKVSGPIATIRALKEGDVQAEVSLSDGKQGTATFAVKVTGPEALRFEAEPLTVTLLPAVTP